MSNVKKKNSNAIFWVIFIHYHSYWYVHLTKIPTFFQGSNLCHGNLGKIPEITEQFSTRHATSNNHCIYDTVTNYINWKSTYVWELQKDEKMSKNLV